jgi:hypothetical protein
MTETIHGIEVSASSACHTNQKMTHRIQKELGRIERTRLAMVFDARNAGITKNITKYPGRGEGYVEGNWTKREPLLRIRRRHGICNMLSGFLIIIIKLQRL